MRKPGNIELSFKSRRLLIGRKIGKMSADFQTSPSFTPWPLMKKRLISPGVFKPSYLKECEQGTNSNFKFDPKTASLWLTLHNDNTVCTFNAFGADQGTGAPYPSNGLNALECVLGDKRITKGRFYWEVVVSASREFCVGVTYHESARSSMLGENNQSWVIRKFKHSPCLYAMTMGRIEQQISQSVSVIGILFDYDKGILSFYDAESRRHLYSFYSSFSEPCLPAFAIANGGSIQLRPCDPVKVRYNSARPRSNYIRRDETPTTIRWAPETPQHYSERPGRWQMPHAERDWDGSWKVARVKSAQINSTRLQMP